MLWIYLFGCFVFLHSVNGYGMFRTKIPNGWAVKHPCKDSIWKSVGHVVPDYRQTPGVVSDKNLFGQKWRDSGQVWNRAICEEDSDGDGLTNGEELGDANCDWREGGHEDPILGHPGFCEPQRSKCNPGGSFKECPHSSASGQGSRPAPIRERPGVGGGRIDISMGGPTINSMGGPTDRRMGGRNDRSMAGGRHSFAGKRGGNRRSHVRRFRGGDTRPGGGGGDIRRGGGGSDVRRGGGGSDVRRGGGGSDVRRGGGGSDVRRGGGGSDVRRGGGGSDIRQGGGASHGRFRPDTMRIDGGGIDRRYRETPDYTGTPEMRVRPLSDRSRPPGGHIPTGVLSGSGSWMRVGDRGISPHNSVDPPPYNPPTPLYPGGMPVGSGSRSAAGSSSPDSSMFAEIPSLDPSMVRSSVMSRIDRLQGDRTTHGRTSGGPGTYDRTHGTMFGGSGSYDRVSRRTMPDGSGVYDGSQWSTMSGGSGVYDRVSRRTMSGGYGPHYVPPGPPHGGSPNTRHFIPPPFSMRRDITRSSSTSSAGTYHPRRAEHGVMYPPGYP